MKILFLHGWHSTPGGLKPSFLAERGHEVLNPALCPDNFEKALQSGQQAFDLGKPDVVIGSSRGGAVAMNLSNRGTPLVLMCPAWKHWGTAKSVQEPCLILHSSKDEIVEFGHSEELLVASGLSRDRLIDVGVEHRMACAASLEAMEKACLALFQADSQGQETAIEGTPGGRRR